MLDFSFGEASGMGDGDALPVGQGVAGDGRTDVEDAFDAEEAAKREDMFSTMLEGELSLGRTTEENQVAIALGEGWK